MRRTEPAPSRRRRANETFQLQLFPAAEECSAVEPVPEPTAAPGVVDLPAGTDIVCPSEEAEDRLLDRLRRALPKLGSLTLTDNRSTIVSAREAGGAAGTGAAGTGAAGTGRLDVRIQRCFAEAPDETLAAVATFLSSGKGSRARRRALAVIRAYFERHRPSPSGVRRRSTVLRPVGRALDLREVRDELNRKYFDGELDVHVTWGRAPSQRRRRGRRKKFSVRLGTYGDHDRVVRIHRCLDRADVPRYVVLAVVYHEMLHAAVPPVVENGRRRIHTPEFRRRERLLPSYQRAEHWLDRNLKRLI